jgi:hypothetical protein
MTSRRPRRASQLQRLIAGILPFIIVGAILYGCSSDRPRATDDGSRLPTAAEPCQTDGLTRDCHQPGPTQNGVRTCQHGTQICRGGRWSACGEYGESTLETQNLELAIGLEPSAGDLRPMTHLAAGVADASACTLNPCMPDCRGYDEDAGPLSTDASLKPDAVTGVAATPPGFVDKLLQDKAHHWGADCERWNTGNNETGHVHSACQSDYYCQRHSSGTNGNCAQFGEGPTETHAGKLGGTTNGGVECLDAYPDLTLGTPCGLGGSIIVPICNRGSAPVPANTVVTVAVEPNQLTTPTAPTLTAVASTATPMAGCPTYPAGCNVTLPTDLNPGQCFRFDLATCGTPLNGTKSLYVNATGSIRECVIQPRVLGPPISAHSPTVEQSLQYGCANNYTAFNSQGVPACLTLHEPKTVTFAYNGVCPPGAIAQWGKLAWSASTPTTTNIIFEVRVRTRATDGGFGAWSPWARVGKAKQSSAPPDDPQLCQMNGPAPCPKDLYAPLVDAGPSAVAAQGEELELRITLNPVGTVGPTLYGYELAHTCLARE